MHAPMGTKAATSNPGPMSSSLASSSRPRRPPLTSTTTTTATATTTSSDSTTSTNTITNTSTPTTSPTPPLLTLIKHQKWTSVTAHLTHTPQSAHQSDEYFQLPLHWACQCKAPLSIIQTLLHIHPTAAKSKNNYASLPLHFLFIDGYGPPKKDVVQLVIEAYPSAVRAKNDGGELPLHYACRNKEITMEVISLLMEYFPEGAFSLNNNFLQKSPVYYALENNTIKSQICAGATTFFVESARKKRELEVVKEKLREMEEKVEREGEGERGSAGEGEGKWKAVQEELEKERWEKERLASENERLKVELEEARGRIAELEGLGAGCDKLKGANQP